MQKNAWLCCFCKLLRAKKCVTETRVEKCNNSKFVNSANNRYNLIFALFSSQKFMLQKKNYIIKKLAYKLHKYLIVKETRIN